MSKSLVEKFKEMLIDEAFDRRGTFAHLYGDDPLLLVTPNDVAGWFEEFVGYEELTANKEEN